MNKNKYLLNEDIHFEIIEKQEGFYQNAYSSEKGFLESKRIDIIIGLGTKGQPI
ncbi:hypothetical protein [Aquimarina algiphila]|uniref:hypothetical protein n=1 Tax=Aquimarina algiphila TaxID=2047982 RepID=UPI0024917F31|nr:hypothetical protein [Aquimarina algiphila]